MNIIKDILTITIIIVFAFITVAAEIALLQSKTSQIDPKDKFLYKMVTHKSEFLSTIQVGITLASMIAGWAGEPAMTNLLQFLPIPENILQIVSFIVITYISIVLSELLPKNVAMAFTQSTLKKVALPIRIIHIVFYPMVWMLDHSSKLLSKILNVPVVNEQEDIYTQEQLLRVVENSSKDENSDLSTTDLQLIMNATTLDEKLVIDYQTPKEKISENVHLYSRIPNLDLHEYSYKGHNYPLMEVQWNDNLHKALQTMIDYHTSILEVIKDKETIGIITNTDIYQEMFGQQLEDEKVVEL